MIKPFTLLRFFFLFLLLASGHLAKANTQFTDARVNIAYDYLKGTVSINYMYLDVDGIDDEMDRATLWYVDPTTGYDVLLFDHGYVGREWNGYSVNTNVTGSGPAYVGDDLYYVYFEWNSIPAHLLGKNIKFKFKCNWDIDADDRAYLPYNFTTEKNLNLTSITAPSSFTATTNQCNKVVLNWNAPELNSAPDARLNFYIYRNGINLTPKSAGLDKSARTFTDETPADGAVYQYVLETKITLGKTQHISTKAPIIGQSLPQPAIVRLSIVQDPCTQSVKLDWTKLTRGADKFILERSTQANFSSKSVLVNDQQTYSFEDKPATNTQYYYRLRVQNTCGEGNETILPFKPDYALPQLFIPNPVEINGSIVLSWQNLALCYMPVELKLEKRNQKTGVVESITLANNATSYQDKDVFTCTEYRYKLTLKQQNNTLYSSNLVYSRVNETIDDALLSLDASKGYYANKVTLEWTAQKNNLIQTYQIYRRPYGDVDYKLLKNIRDGSLTWTDDNTDAGKYYEYKLVATTTCVDAELQSNEIVSLGFRQPTGTVAGQISYSGGTAVPGVKVLSNPNTAGLGRGTALELDGRSTIRATLAAKFDFSKGFTIESWINLKTFAHPDGPSPYFFYNNAGFIYAYFDDAAPSLEFIVGSQDDNGNANFQTLSYDLQKDSLKIWNEGAAAGDWNHISLNYNKDTVKIYINGKVVAKRKSIALAEINFDFDFAPNVLGAVDEIRVWNRSLSDEETARYYQIVASGTEPGLVLNYHLDEGAGRFVFDASQNNDGFNGNHGVIQGSDFFDPQVTTAHFTDIIPVAEQLSRHAYTDEVGAYIIKGIPYRNEGELFRVTPVFGQHTFDPPSKTVFLGDGQFIQNNVNFIDISSFQATGRIIYRDTDFPVDSAFIKIDGVNAFGRDKLPIVTNKSGEFSVSVPIGKHYLSFEKNGHVFKSVVGVDSSISTSTTYGKARSAGFYPGLDSLGLPLLRDFQEAIANLMFFDDTKVLLTGRIVGGTKEGDKKIGFGLSENNIGTATVRLEPLKPYSLKPNTTENNFIEFSTDPKTGEYKQLIIPEEFNVASVSIPNSTYTFSEPAFKAKVDLRGALTPIVEIDSVYKESIVDGNTVSTFDSSRTFKYNLRRDWIYRSNPSIEVTAKGNTWLSDETFDYLDKGSVKTTIPLRLTNNVNQFAYPVFTQLRRYPWKIWVFEKYTHPVSKKETTVDVTDASITVSNNLATPNTPLVLETDSTGRADYAFFGGFPNTTLDNNNPANSFTKTASMLAKTGSGKIANWPSQGVYRAYLFGGYPVGNNFVTTGPNKVDFILRDPPGSGSSAKLEKGSKVSTTRTTSYENGNEGELEQTLNVGIKFEVQTGSPGATVTKEAVTKNIAGFTAAHSENLISENSTVTSTTFTESFSTSAEAGFVGSSGDVFIGNSTNIVYGTSLDLSITELDRIPIGGTKLPTTQVISGKTLTIGIRESIRVNPEFNTFFVYSQQQIIDNVIPGLKKLRNLLFTNQSNRYKLVLKDSADEKFATNNDDPLWGAAATKGDAVHYGTSYTFIPYKALAPDWKEDSVRYYNNQVKNWENLLLQNEQEKLAGKPNTKHSNISFDNGTAYEGSVETSTETESTSTFEWTLNPGISGEISETIDDFGPSLKLTEKYTHKEVATDVKGTEDTKTVSFSLADTDDDNYYTVDVLDCQSGNGPIFRTKGGQSSCPYEAEELTKYYNVGTSLNKAMVQIYNPVITADIASQEGVPEDVPAIFRLTLSNESAVKVEQWLLLKTDNASNPNGAKIFVDGSPLSGSGITIKIPAGESITKTVEIFKGPDSSDYKGLKLHLKPICEDDEALGEVELNVGFVPACSQVVIETPKNNWIANVYNKDILPVSLNRFNVNLSSFKYISLLYKDAASSTWSTLITYFKRQADFNAFQGAKELIGARTTLDFNWKIRDIVDRDYEIKAFTVCVDGSVFESEIIHGTKDTKRPGPFGAPQPADGVLSAGDEIVVQFDEPIISGLLLANKQFVTVKGVLNGTELFNQSSLEFNGSTDQAIIGDGITLGNASFTIEAWVYRNANQAGAIWSFGEASANQLKLSFDGSGKLIFSDATKNYMGTKSYQLGKWYHIALVYDAGGQTLKSYQDDQLDLNASAVTITSFPTGRASFGFDLAQKAGYFAGRIRDFRIWTRAIPFDIMYARKSAKLSGNEPGLLGYWLMDEKMGKLTRDRAHLRHATLNATWNVEPKGKSVYMGGSAYVTLDGRNINIDQETDFTIELWFNGKPGVEQTLLSSGRGTADELFNVRKSLAITAAPTGIQVQSNGKTFQLSTKDLLDNNWHHLALVVNRRGNAKGFVDGALVSQTDVSGFGGFGEDFVYLGARRWKTSTNNFSNDRLFTGAIDEVRFWKTARSADQIAAYLNNRVSITEVGLTGYYPFEKYIRDQANAVTLTFNKADQWLGDPQTLPGGEATYTGTVAEYNQTPNMELERPAKDLNFDLAINGDKVLITLKEPLSLIENCLLEFSIRDATDLQNNVLASPIQWSAFVDKNQVKWETAGLKLEKVVGSSQTFTAKIRNFGGQAQSFVVSNLPAWLIASPSSGTLNALASTEITFTISAALNNGTYTEDLYLASENGVNERLALSLRVFNPAPDWVVMPEKYEYSMNAIGLLRINGLFSRNPNDLVGVFKNGICRGVTNLNYIAQTDQYMVFLDIYGNREDINTDFEVKVWNDNLGEINAGIQVIDGSVIKKAITFSTTGFLGKTSSPVIFSADNTLEQSIPLLAGWNWMSFNLTSAKQLTVAKLFESLSPTSGDIVKSLSLFEEYALSTGWFGAITAGGGFDNVSMYQLKSAKKDTLVYSGLPLVPANTKLNISAGWNWISYVPTSSTPVEDALANLNPLADDVIKGQRDFAIFDKNLGWIGSLKTMRSGAGYKYFSSDPKAKFFSYPNRSFFAKSKEEPIDRSPETRNHIVPESYETNMNLIAVVKGPKATEYSWLLAKIDGKAVGCVAPVEVNGTLHYFSTIYGQDKAEKLSFALMNPQTGAQIALKESLLYHADEVVGNLQAPFVFEIADAPIATVAAKLEVWPQPFTEVLNLSIEQSTPGEVTIELYDLNGRKLGILYQGIHEAGRFNLSLNKNTHALLNQAAGVYSLRVVSGDAVQTKVVIKQ